MTLFRRTTPDAEAAQWLPTPEKLLTFSDEPHWLQTAIQTGTITLRDVDGEPGLVLQAYAGPLMLHPTDWIVLDRLDRIGRVPAGQFEADYDELVEAPTTTPAEVKA